MGKTINKLRNRVFRKKVTHTMVLTNKEDYMEQLETVAEKLKEVKTLVNELVSLEIKISTNKSTRSSD